MKYRNPNGVAFNSTGPRVPAIIAGPFAPRGVSNTLLDNTSILQLMAERFGKHRETYSPEVSGRMKQNIQSVSTVLSLAANNTTPCDLSGVISHSTPHPAPTATVANKLRDAFEQSARGLAARHRGEAFAKYPELRAYIERPSGTNAAGNAGMSLMPMPTARPTGKAELRKKPNALAANRGKKRR